MGSAIDDIDYYALLDVPNDATMEQIKTAYRKRSLKVHPDRNPDNPQAAQLFHELNLASQVLLDPKKRASFDALHQARQARAQRFAQLDSNRREMANELERAEHEYKRRKTTERAELTELDKLREQGRKMRETKAAQQQGQASRPSPQSTADTLKRAASASRNTETAAVPGSPNGDNTSSTSPLVEQLGPLDTTLKLRWPRSRALTDSTSLNLFIRQLLASSASSPSLEQIDPGIDVVLGQGDKIPKGRASVKFRTLDAALKLVEACHQATTRAAAPSGSPVPPVFQGVEVTWAAGQEPRVLQQRQRNQTREQQQQQPRGAQKNLSDDDGHNRERAEAGYPGTTATTLNAASGNPSTAPGNGSAHSFPRSMLVDSDEDRVLAQLRARERAKMEEELRKQDEEDERQEQSSRV